MKGRGAGQGRNNRDKKGMGGVKGQEGRGEGRCGKGQLEKEVTEKIL